MNVKGFLVWNAVPLILFLMLGCSQAPKDGAAPKSGGKAISKPQQSMQTKPPAPTSKAEPATPAAPPQKSDPLGSVIEGTGKAIGEAGKVLIEGGGKVLDTTGKIVIDGGGKLLDGAGKVVIDGGGKVIAGTGEAIGGAGMAIGKAVGEVVETVFAAETKAPDFTLRDLEGRPVSLSDFKGFPVVLLFCTTNYPPCVVEMRHLRDLQSKYEGDGLRVVAIALDWEGPAALRRFQQEMALNYPLLWDNGEVFKKYTSLPNVPTTFFINRNGHVVKKRVGFASATIVTEGSAVVGTTLLELDKGFEKDLLELLKK